MFLQTDFRIAVEAVRCHPATSAAIAFDAMIPIFAFPKGRLGWDPQGCLHRLEESQVIAAVRGGRWMT